MSAEGEQTDYDGLFRLPLHEFTAARNALATRLQKSGQKEEAARVRGTPKPPVSAWVLNQLYWRERPWFDRLIAAAAHLRQTHADTQSGRPTNIQGPLREQREALNELSRRAAALLQQVGHSASPDILRRVTQGLQGIAAREASADGPQPGRLTADVAAPGFEALSAIVARAADAAAPGGRASRVLAFNTARGAAPAAPAREAKKSDAVKQAEARARQAAARRTLHDADRQLERARRAAKKAEQAMRAAAARAKDAEKTRTQAEAALEKAVAAAEKARQEARRAAGTAADEAQAVTDAERAVARAKAALDGR